MIATTATKTVAPFEGFGRELMWAAQDYSTGVMLTADLFASTTRVVRPGKGDYLEVNLAAARFGDAPAPITRSGDAEVVAYLACREGEPVIARVVGEFEVRYPNVETALVELAYYLCS